MQILLMVYLLPLQLMLTHSSHFTTFNRLEFHKEVTHSPNVWSDLQLCQKDLITNFKISPSPHINHQHSGF